jgi:hypothetical protein
MAHHPVRIGFATRDITPPLPTRLSGYGDRVGEATEVHDPLEVRTVVATDGRSTLCLLALDLMAMSRDWAEPIRDAVADALGTERSGVLTSCVHTHAAPSTLSGSDAIGWPVPLEYREPLTHACVAAAIEAARVAEPARLRYVRAPLPDRLAYNRRDHPFTPSLAVVEVVRDDGGDDRVGTIVNVGVHPVVLGPRNLAISADWVGAMRRSLERELGGTALFVQGCEGDIDPVGKCWDGAPDAWFAAVDDAGTAMARAARDALAVAAPVEGPVGVAVSRVIDVADPDGPLVALSRLRGPLHVELVEWDLAGVRVISVPGEGAAGFAARVLAARPEPLLLAGLAPHWLGYFPVPFTDGYEEGLSYGERAVETVLGAVSGAGGAR